MPEAEPGDTPGRVLMDAGMFIGALLIGDSRHAEARPLVEEARRGTLLACTTTGILSAVYGALTWEKVVPRHDPVQAAEAVRLLAVKSPKWREDSERCTERSGTHGPEQP